MLKIVKLIAFWILGLVVVSVLGSLAIPKIENRGLGAPSPSHDFNYYLSLAQWDGGNYLEIAENGYTKRNFYAFAPLYPLAINLTSKIFRFDYVLSGLTISVVTFVLFITILYKYVTKIRNQKIAQSVALTFIFFPTSFFCLLVYSESIFLFLAILAIYLLEKKVYAVAVLVSSLLPLARFIGVFVVLANMFLIYKKGNHKILLAGLFLATLPFLFYLVLLFFIAGDSFLFSSAQSAWGRFALDPFSTIFLYLNAFFTFNSISINSFFDFATTIVFTAVLTKNISKLAPNIWVISMLAIIIPATTGTLTGMPRYALGSFGFFIVAGEYLHYHPSLKLWVWPAALALQAVLLSLFLTGHWVA